MTTSTTRPVHTLNLEERQLVAEGTMAFLFERPEGFSFEAGQFLQMTLVDPPETDPEGDSRTFSIASAPHQRHLMIATRMRDTAFKRVLGAAAIGSAVTVKPAEGSFTLATAGPGPVVLLAGGIGITPFLSMVRDACHQQRPGDLCLFYSNKSLADAPFYHELQETIRVYPQFRLVVTMTEDPPDGVWMGERGFVDEAMLRRHIPDLSEAVYYVAGPPAMVEAMQATLNGLGITPDRIRAEQFAGY
jgi:ferredoxin-NADP reductase